MTHPPPRAAAAPASPPSSAGPLPLVVGVSAPSGTGKTTLLRRLIPRLKAAGLRVGVLKRAHHDFDIDHPGKDSYEVRHAGADRVLVASARRWAVVAETPDAAVPSIADLIARLDPGDLDLVLAEGFGLDGLPRIVVHRAAAAKQAPDLGAPGVLAVCSDDPALETGTTPRFDLDDVAGLCGFLIRMREAGTTHGETT